MAEAKDTTSPSLSSRRVLLAGGAIALLTPAMPSPALPVPGEPDPVLARWRDWHALNAEAESHFTAWQKVESLLFRTIGFPKVTVPRPGEGSVQVMDDESIDDLVGTAPETEALRARLHADLAARQARWQEAAAACGLDALEERQDEAYRRAEAMAGPVFAAPAGSLAGVAAKLTLVLQLGQPGPRDQDFPWPQLRSALADLQRLARLPPLLP